MSVISLWDYNLIVNGEDFYTDLKKSDVDFFIALLEGVNVSYSSCVVNKQRIMNVCLACSKENAEFVQKAIQTKRFLASSVNFAYDPKLVTFSLEDYF
jgi:hypothetical protein